jgi:hypothetical protein
MPVHVEILLMTVFQVETESLHVRFCLQMPINNILHVGNPEHMLLNKFSMSLEVLILQASVTLYF